MTIGHQSVKLKRVVADNGAGTELHTRLFAVVVGPKGQIFAVDIVPNFSEQELPTTSLTGARPNRTRFAILIHCPRRIMIRLPQ